jgi:hypothetical protein
MTRLSLPALALLAGAVPAAAQQVDTALASLVNAERAFSAMSQARGVADAFLANAADSGLVFTPRRRGPAISMPGGPTRPSG